MIEAVLAYFNATVQNNNLVAHIWLVSKYSMDFLTVLLTAKIPMTELRVPGVSVGPAESRSKTAKIKHLQFLRFHQDRPGRIANIGINLFWYSSPTKYSMVHAHGFPSEWVTGAWTNRLGSLPAKIPMTTLRVLLGPGESVDCQKVNLKQQESKLTIPMISTKPLQNKQSSSKMNAP